MSWGLAARWIPRAAREVTHRVSACRKLHQQRVIPAETLVDHVLGLRVLVCQHVRGESPFADSDLSDLSSALEKFVETYELGDAVEVLEPAPVKPEPEIEIAADPEPDPIPPTPVVEDEPPFDLPERPQRVNSAPPARCVAVAPAQPSSRITLRAMDAAERFVEWVRLANRCATYSSQDLTKLYAEHCEAEDLVVLADNILRPALLRVEGVTKLKSDSGRKKRERQRYFLWRIDPAPAATVVQPWTELPQSTERRVA